MPGTVERRVHRGTRIHLIANIEPGHIVRIVTEKVQQRRSAVRENLRNPPDAKVLPVHQSTKNGQQRRLHTVPIVHVQVVPTALGGKLL